MVQDIFNIKKRAFESNLNEDIIVMIQKQHIFINRSERIFCFIAHHSAKVVVTRRIRFLKALANFVRILK